MAAPMEAGPEQDAQQPGPFSGPSTACQIPGCDRILEDNPRYYKKFRVCKYHANLLEYDGTRFCQQCGRFQPVDEFEGDRKSCRASLQKHNMRRRLKAAAKRASSSVTEKDSPTAATTAAAAGAGAAGSGAGHGPASPQAEPLLATSPVVAAALGAAPPPAAAAAAPVATQPQGEPVSLPQPSGSGSTMRIAYPGPASPTSQPPSPAPPPPQALQQQLSRTATSLQGLQHQQHVLQQLQQQWERQRYQRQQEQQQQHQQQQQLLGLSFFGQEQLPPGMLVEQQLDLLTTQELESLAGRLAGQGSLSWGAEHRLQGQQPPADWAAVQHALNSGHQAPASHQQQHQRQAVQQGSPQQLALPGGAVDAALQLPVGMVGDARTWLPSLGQQQHPRQPHHQQQQQALAPDGKAGLTALEGDGASLESEQLAASWELLNEIRASSSHASGSGLHAPFQAPAGPYNAQGLPAPPPTQAQGVAAQPARPETPFPMWLRNPNPVLGPPLRTLPLHNTAPPLPLLPLPLLPLQQLGQGPATAVPSDPSLPPPGQPVHHQQHNHHQQQQQQQQLPPASAPPGVHGQGWAPGPAPRAPGWEQVRPPPRHHQQQQQQQPPSVGLEQAGVLEVLSQRVFGVAPHLLAPHVREAVVTLMAQDPDFVARVLSGIW